MRKPREAFLLRVSELLTETEPRGWGTERRAQAGKSKQGRDQNPNKGKVGSWIEDDARAPWRVVEGSAG